MTSTGFPSLNITETDGIDLEELLRGDKAPAEVLQDSRRHPVNTSGTITARQFRHGVAMDPVGADFDHGMSGGPTINSRGEVYGVNSQMTVPFFGQNFNVITDTGMLREFLGHDEPQAAGPGQRGSRPSGRCRCPELSAWMTEVVCTSASASPSCPLSRPQARAPRPRAPVRHRQLDCLTPGFRFTPGPPPPRSSRRPSDRRSVHFGTGKDRVTRCRRADQR
jgi:hypothetical protein